MRYIVNSYMAVSFSVLVLYRMEKKKRKEKKNLPRVSVSHLLDLLVCPAGRRTRRASKQSFISLRRLRSASLCVTRNSGVRL